MNPDMQFKDISARIRNWGLRLRWQETARWAPRGLGATVQLIDSAGADDLRMSHTPK